MVQKRKLTERTYAIGLSKIKFSTYVRELHNRLQNRYEKVMINDGRKKQTILQIYSAKSNFSLIVSEENRNRGDTKINIGFARIDNEELTKLENEVDTILTEIFSGDIQKNSVQ